jgi:hypothetical protein
MECGGRVVPIKKKTGDFSPARIQIAIIQIIASSVHEHPLVDPHVSHFMQVPFLTMV